MRLKHFSMKHFTFKHFEMLGGGSGESASLQTFGYRSKIGMRVRFGVH